MIGTFHKDPPNKSATFRKSAKREGKVKPTDLPRCPDVWHDDSDSDSMTTTTAFKPEAVALLN